MARKASAGPGLFGRDVVRILKGVMQEKQLLQKDISETIGISPSQISRILSFEKEMTIDQLEGFCIAIGFDLLRVLRLAEDERVWSSGASTKVDGIPVAPDILSDSERVKLQNLTKASSKPMPMPISEAEKVVEKHKSELDARRAAKRVVVADVPAEESEELSDDEIVAKINAGEFKVAAQKRTAPIEESFS